MHITDGKLAHNECIIQDSFLQVKLLSLLQQRPSKWCVSLA